MFSLKNLARKGLLSGQYRPGSGTWHVLQGAFSERCGTIILPCLYSIYDFKVFRLGVTKDTDFKTPNSDYMGPQAKQAWIAERAFTALYIAAHRGYLKLAQKLIMAGKVHSSALGDLKGILDERLSR